MSNLFKRGSTVSQNERVIDYNDVIKSKIQSFIDLPSKGKIDADGFISGLNAEVVQSLLDPNVDNFGANIENQQLLIKKAELESAYEKSDDIIKNANKEYENIIYEANNQADDIRKEAYFEGKDKGLADAKKEIEQQIAQRNQEYDRLKAELNQEYNEMKAKIEPELVGVLTDVFKNIIHSIADSNEGMILDLVNNVMHNADISREFVIKVSPDDYKFLINNQGKIYCAMSKDVRIEIVEDLTMEKNQCVIESDVGVYDCSLDIQLEKLIKDIKLLSCI